MLKSMNSRITGRIFTDLSLSESDTDEEEGFIGNAYSSEDPNSGVELEIGEDGMNATVTVSEAVLKEFEEAELTVRVEMKPKNTEYAQETVASNYDELYVYEPSENYNNLPDREETWLVGEDRNIDRVGSVWRQNSFEDEEYYFVIEDAEVDNADVLSVVKEPFEGESTDSGNYQWIVRALKKGEATVTLTGSYIEYDSNGNEINSDQGEFSYTFTITVVNDIYSVDIDSVDGRFRALPGDSIELTTNFDHRSTGDIENDNISYTWSFEGGEEFAEFVDADGTVTEPEGENAIVRFKELPEGTDGIDESVIVKVVANNNNVAVADNTCDLNVSSSYVEMQPLRLTEEQANTPVDGEFEFRPVLKRFDMENTEGVIVPISYISFEEDNDDAISSTRDYDDEGYVFRIKRLSEEDASFVIGAYYGTGGEEEYDYIWQRYRFNPIENKEIRFEQDYNNALFNDEYKDLIVDTSDLGDGWENKYAIVYKAGIWDDEIGNFTKQFGSYCLELDDEDPTVVTLNGRKIWDEFQAYTDDRSFLVIAEVWEKDESGELIGDGPVCDTSDYFYSVEAEFDFDLGDRGLLPGDDFTINKLENGKVRDADYPDWGDAYFEVLSVDIGTQSPVEDGENVISITDPEEYEQYWRITAENCGYAEVTVSYLDHKGRDSNGKTSEDLDPGEELVPYTCTVPVFVQDKLYEADIINLSGDDRALPGDVLSLEANARIRYVDQPDSSEGLTYSWAITDKNGYAYFVDEDGDRIDNPEGKEVSLKFGDFPDDYEGGALQTDVMLTVYDEGTEAFTTTRSFYLEDRIETLVWDGFDSDMDVGDVDETTLSVINREIGEEDTPIETYFVVTSENDGIIVENNGDGNYTLIRKDGSENRIYVHAEFEGENGSYTIMDREFYLPEKNYGVWLEGEDDLSVRDDDEDKELEMHLAGFDKLIKEGKVDADSFDVSVVTAKVPRDEEGNEIEVMPSEEDIVTLDPEIIKNKAIEENNKLIITLDGTKIPHEVGEEENAFEVERISLNVTATRSDVDTSIFDEVKVVLYEDEGIGSPVFVTWTCATLGHDWSEPLYTWAEDYSSVTAGHYCMRDTHAPIVYMEEETVETTSVSEGASCTVPGTITYTATFTKEGFETQTMQVEGGTLPHEWDEASYEWAEGDGSVTASHVCAVCGTEESESVETISEVKGTPDCEHGTVTTYTAAFTKPGFETQTKDVENDDALGHDWGEPEYTWADDNSSVTATIACGRDSSHNKTETVDTTSEQTLDPTCEEMGETTYTATFTATYMKLKAGTELFSQNGFACNLQAAGTQRIKLAEELQKGSGVHYAAVWPEVPAAVLLKRTGQENTRILFCRHAYPGISL